MLDFLTFSIDVTQALLVENALPVLLMDRPNKTWELAYEQPSIVGDGGVLFMADGFAERLKQLRKQKDLSQGELAKLVGIHWNHIGRYERGASRPSADALHKIATALGVSGDYLIEGSTNDAAKASFEDRDLLRMFQEAEKLTHEDKEIIKSLLDAFLTKKQLQRLVSR